MTPTAAPPQLRRTDYATLRAEPIAGSLGAELRGLDLSGSLSNVELADLRQAIVDHHVVFLRDQPFAISSHEELTQRLGGTGDTPFVESIEGHPGLVRVVREASEAGISNFGGGWHSDWSFQPAPPSLTLLHAVDVPPFGGDTLWANMALAYDLLSPGLRSTLDTLDVVHSARRSYGPGTHIDRTANQRAMRITASQEAWEEYVHPLVTTHPENGRRVLAINPTYVIRIDGWTAEESAPLLEQLQRHSVREALTCRFRWTANTLAIWDNRITQHNALNDYDGFRREAYRTTVVGTPPCR